MIRTSSLTLLCGAALLLASPAFGGIGYWDLFSVNATPNGYYWNLAPIGDPLVQPDPAGGFVIDNTTPLGGVAYGFGGNDWNTFGGSLESEVSASLQIQGGAYLSVVLDTYTSPHTDNLFPSWGEIDVMVQPWDVNTGDWGAPVVPNWVVSPLDGYGGAGTGLIAGATSTVALGVPDFNDANNGTQNRGIYGVGAQLMGAANYLVTFDTNLHTWDSYRMAGGGPGGIGGPGGPNPFVIPGLQNLIPLPLLVPGKEYTDYLDNTFNGVPDPGKNLFWQGDGTGFALGDVVFAGEVDAQAAGQDYLYFPAVNDDVPLIFSIKGSGDLNYEYAKYPVQGTWAAAPQINSIDVPEDVNSVELWSGQPAFELLAEDTGLISLEGDPNNVAIFNPLSGSPFLLNSDLAAALGATEPIDLDALMAWDDNLNGEFDGGDSIMFSVAPTTQFTGGEVWVWNFGSTPQFLFHGGHLWDGSDGDVNALEAVAGQRIVPEPNSLFMLLAGIIGLAAWRSR